MDVTYCLKLHVKNEARLCFCVLLTCCPIQLQQGSKREASCDFRKPLVQKGHANSYHPRAKVKQLFLSVSAGIVPAALCAVQDSTHLSQSTLRAQLCLKDTV